MVQNESAFSSSYNFKNSIIKCTKILLMFIILICLIKSTRSAKWPSNVPLTAATTTQLNILFVVLKYNYLNILRKEVECSSNY